MKVLFYFSTVYLAIIGIFALFYNFTERKLRFKLFLIVLAISALLFSLWYDNKEKALEKQDRDISETTTRQKLDKVDNQLAELKEKENKSPLQEDDYLRYICLYLDRIDINLSGISRNFRKDFALDYFSDLEKIPKYFNFEEWKNTESKIYERNIEKIKGDFSSRGMSSNVEPYLNELKENRERVSRAKERELSNR